jgi:hypothetical protein
VTGRGRRSPAKPRAGDARAATATGPSQLESLGAGLIALVIYLACAPPVSGDKDAAEFTLVLALNGVAHPTGYPLFTLLGHGFVRLVHALGATWAYAANAWAALGGATAVYLLHRLSTSLLSPSATLGRRARSWIAALPVVFLVFNPIWTYETTLAEVYSWHVAWLLATTLLFVHLVRGMAAETPPPARRLHRGALAWGLACSVGAAHHATAVAVVVPLSLALLVVLVVRRRLRLVFLLEAVLAALVPLSAYGFILWRASHPAPVQWFALAPGWDGLAAHVLGRQYSGLVGHFAPDPVQRTFLNRYVYPFLFPGILLAIFAAFRARGLAARASAWGIAASALAGLLFAFSYAAPDPSSYFLHPMVLGLVSLAPVAEHFARDARRGRTALAGALLTLVGLTLWVPWLRTDFERVRLFVGFDALVHTMWRSIPMDSAMVFWSNDMHHKLLEYQLLDGEKPGLDVLDARNLAAPRVREAFVRRYGFDPIGPGDVAVITEDAAGVIEERVNTLARVPVIHFDPRVPTVRLLRRTPADTVVAAVPR